MPLSLRESIAQTREIPRSDAVIMGRAELLAPADRDLIEAVFLRNQSAASLARIMGIPERRLQRRVHRLMERLTSPEFLDAARALDYLAEMDARIARLRFCQGLPLRRIALMLNLSYHRLRRRVDRISAQIAALRKFQQEQTFRSAG